MKGVAVGEGGALELLEFLELLSLVLQPQMEGLFSSAGTLGPKRNFSQPLFPNHLNLPPADLFTPTLFSLLSIPTLKSHNKTAVLDKLTLTKLYTISQGLQVGLGMHENKILCIVSILKRA